MDDGGYEIRNKREIHFLSMAVVEWVDVFTRKQYRDIVVDSLRHCQEEKGLQLRGWCIMSNHLHLLISSGTNDISSIIRDSKNSQPNKF
jgi:putative transposase